MTIIWLSYHVIWQSKSDLVIWHIYDRYMTGIWHRLSYDCHIPVISLDTTWCHIDGTYRHIPVICHQKCRDIWMIYDSLFLSYVLLLESRRRQALRPAAESRLKCSGTQSLDCKGVYCASASLNASVPLGSRHGVAGASHRCRRRRRWPQSRTADVGSSGSVVTLPGRTSSRL